MPSGAQVGRVADARQLEQLRRVERAAAEDDLAGPGCAPSAPAPARPRRRPPGAPSNTIRVTNARRPDLEVRAPHDRVEVGPGRAQPAAPADVPVERGEALLAIAVDVVGQRVAGLLGGLEERPEQRVRGRPALQDRAARRGRGTGRPAPPPGSLHPLEVRQAVGVVPGRHARVGRPALVVERVAALEDHPVDAARAAEHLAPGVVDPPAVHVRLGLRLVLPVVEPAADRERQRRRHVDEHVPRVVGPAGLEDEDAGRRVGAQPVGERAAGRAAADDDEVVRSTRSWSRC